MFVSVSERASKLEFKVKQTWRFVFLLPKNECFIILASCTTLSVLCKSFQRTLSLFSPSSSCFCEPACFGKRMQRYSFLLNHQRFYDKILINIFSFNSYLHNHYKISNKLDKNERWCVDFCKHHRSLSSLISQPD